MHLWGQDQAGRDQIDPNAGSRHFLCETDRHSGQCTLGGIVVGHVRVGSRGAHGAEIDDTAPVALAHRGQKLADEALRGEHVFLIDVQPVGTDRRLPGTALSGAVIVDENVWTGLVELAEERLTTRITADITGYCLTAAELGDGSCRLARFQAVDIDTHTFGHELPGDD